MADDLDRPGVILRDCLQRMRAIGNRQQNIHFSAQVDKISLGFSFLMPSKSAIGADADGGEERQSCGNVAPIQAELSHGGDKIRARISRTGSSGVGYRSPDQRIVRTARI